MPLFCTHIYHQFHARIVQTLTSIYSKLCFFTSALLILERRSDHFPVLTSLNIQSPEHVQPTSQPYRRIASIDPAQFATDITQSDLICNPPSGLQELVECYNSTLSQLLDKHAPLITKSRRTRPHPWYTSALHTLQLACRKAERIWKQTRSEVDRLALKNSRCTYYSAVKQAKQTFHSKLVTGSIGNPRKL